VRRQAYKCVIAGPGLEPVAKEDIPLYTIKVTRGKGKLVSYELQSIA
jgi:hypothetical protein